MSSQSLLDALGCRRLSSSLLESCTSTSERASFLASQTPLSRGWLTALPIPQVGTVLDDASFRIGVCLRLGVAPCASDRCSRCSCITGPESTHGLHCRRSAGWFSRHSAINEVICRSLCSAQIPARREPTGLYSTQTRPDGLTLVPWRLGECMVWDATVVITLAPSHVLCDLSSAYEFVPLGFETPGSLGPAAEEFLAT